jgi:hypothetical protein
MAHLRQASSRDAWRGKEEEEEEEEEDLFNANDVNEEEESFQTDSCPQRSAMKRGDISVANFQGLKMCTNCGYLFLNFLNEESLQDHHHPLGPSIVSHGMSR